VGLRRLLRGAVRSQTQRLQLTCSYPGETIYVREPFKIYKSWLFAARVLENPARPRIIQMQSRHTQNSDGVIQQLDSDAQCTVMLTSCRRWTRLSTRCMPVRAARASEKALVSCIRGPTGPSSDSTQPRGRLASTSPCCGLAFPVQTSICCQPHPFLVALH
jgi:hypothetical protein